MTIRIRPTGFTITEAIVVLAIILVVSALLMPIFRSARAASNVSASVSNMRQLYLSMQTYMHDNNGSDGIYDYYALALPTARFYDLEWARYDRSIWLSPCGFDPHKTPLPPVLKTNGWITFAAGFYDPIHFRDRMNADLKDYLQQFKDRSVVLLDFNCNDSSGRLRSAMDPTVEKRAVAILLSGQVISQRRFGNATQLPFYSNRR